MGGGDGPMGKNGGEDGLGEGALLCATYNLIFKFETHLANKNPICLAAHVPLCICTYPHSLLSVVEGGAPG